MARDDYYASPFGVTYSAYMERPWLSRLISRVVWGSDSGPFYESMKELADVPEGGTVVDCPCGAGPALREVPADPDPFATSRQTSRPRCSAAPVGGRGTTDLSAWSSSKGAAPTNI